MMNVYYINLESRRDRRDHMEAQFSKLGMPFERILAVDGSLPEIQEAVKALDTGFTGRKLGANAFACFQSHRNAWKRLLESTETHAMIFEDDLIMAPDLGQYVDPNWLPVDADIVKLETWGGGISVDKKRYPAGQRSLARLRSKHYGGGGYVLSRSAAARLIRGTEVFIDPVDAILFHPKSSMFAQLVIYQMLPAPVVQGDRPIAGSIGQVWVENSMPARYNEPDGKALRRRRKKGQWFRDISRSLRNRILGREALIVPHG